MKSLKVMLFTGEDNAILTCDAIEREGGLWLVTHWNAPPSSESRQPTRLIRIDGLPHQWASEDWPDHDLLLQSPIPKAVLDGTAPPEQEREFDVKVLPAGDQDTIH